MASESPQQYYSEMREGEGITMTATSINTNTTESPISVSSTSSMMITPSCWRSASKPAMLATTASSRCAGEELRSCPLEEDEDNPDSPCTVRITDVVSHFKRTTGMKSPPSFSSRETANRITPTSSGCRTFATSTTSRRRRSGAVPVPSTPRLFTLANIPDDLLCRVTVYLDVASLLRMCCLNRRFRYVSSLPESGWDNLCQQLWKDC